MGSMVDGVKSVLSGARPADFLIRLAINNCLKADPAYGEGVARALGIPTSEIRK